MKIEVDKVKCIGLGLRDTTPPARFEVGDNRQLVLVSGTAVGSCPTAAMGLLP